MRKPWGMVAALCVIIGGWGIAWGDPASDAFNQWKTKLDEAQRRVGDKASGPLRNALGEAQRPLFQLQELAGSLKQRDGEIESAKFTAKFYKGEWEAAQREAKRLSDARDAKYQELQGEFAKLAVELKRLNDWDDRLTAWSKTIEAWRGRLPPKVVPKEQLAAAQAEVDRFNAEVARFNADNDKHKADIAKYDTWQDQLVAIEKFVTEQGKASIAAQLAASKKEKDYWEKQDKLTKLEKLQGDETQKFMALLGPANGAVEAVLSVLNSPAPTASSFAASAAAYVPRTSEAAARAVSLPVVPAGNDGDTVRDRIFVLAPTNMGSDPAVAQAEMARRRLQAEVAAQTIANQYTDVPAGKALATGKAADSTTLVRAPEGFVGPAGASDAQAGITADGTLVVTDEMLHRPFNPGVMISDAEYADALKTREHLGTVIPKLQIELAKLRGLRQGTREYELEFENIRAEAVQGAARDMIGLLGTQISRLAADTHYAGTLTPETLAKLGLALKVVKAGTSYEQMQMTTDAKAQRQRELEILDTTASTLLSASISGVQNNNDARLMLGQMGKMLQIYNKFNRYLNDPATGNRPPREEYGEMAKLGIGVTAIFATPVAVGAGVESLGERGLQRVIIQEAMDSLSASMKKSYDAERFLTEKAERLEGFQTEEQRTIDEYESANAGRRAAMHIGDGSF